MTQATAAQLPDCDLTGSQSQPFSRAAARSVSHIWARPLYRLKSTHTTARAKPFYAEHAKGVALTPGGHDSCRADASESVRIHTGLL